MTARATLRATAVGTMVLVALLANVGVTLGFKATGYTTRHKDIASNSQGLASGTLKCPKGQVVVSGGAFWYEPGKSLDPAFALSSSLTASIPTSKGHSWYASGSTDSPRTLEILIHCLPSSRLGGGYVITTNELSEGGSAIAGSAWYGGSVGCPNGYQVVTGGALWHFPGDPPVPSTAIQHSLSGSAPFNNFRGWYA